LILDDREKEVVMGRFGLEHGGEVWNRGDCEGARSFAVVCVENRVTGVNEVVS
jgi:hypothetical protein